VLTGAGDSFCAGGDFEMDAGHGNRHTLAAHCRSAQLAAMLRVLNELSKPLIGRINGAAYGGAPDDLGL